PDPYLPCYKVHPPLARLHGLQGLTKHVELVVSPDQTLRRRDVQPDRQRDAKGTLTRRGRPADGDRGHRSKTLELEGTQRLELVPTASADDGANEVGGKDLTALRRRAEASGLDDRRAEVVTLVDLHLAVADADPHGQAGDGGAVVALDG